MLPELPKIAANLPHDLQKTQKSYCSTWASEAGNAITETS